MKASQIFPPPSQIFWRSLPGAATFPARTPPTGLPRTELAGGGELALAEGWEGHGPLARMVPGKVLSGAGRREGGLGREEFRGTPWPDWELF